MFRRLSPVMMASLLALAVHAAPGRAGGDRPVTVLVSAPAPAPAASPAHALPAPKPDESESAPSHSPRQFT
jgi:hypothetical protein